MIKQFYYFFIWMRPKQWIKNSIIFIPLLFSESILDASSAATSFFVFSLFCIFVWSIYILNDIRDIEYDKSHTKKKLRPIPSGKLNKSFALATALVMIVSICILVFLVFGKYILLLFLAYLINTVFYIFFIKNIVILDIFSISFGFIVRWLIWILAIQTEVSIWFLLILFFGALFLWFLKRFQEVMLWVHSRKNIDSYNDDFLKQIIWMLANMLIISYSIYTFNSVQNPLLVLTVPFVVFWIIRYLYNISFLKKYSQSIEEVIFGDIHILVNTFLYIVSVVVILYFF